jgi:hypothetical protein
MSNARKEAGFGQLECAVSLQMKIYVTEQRIDDRQTFKVVPNVKFFGHTHASVQLHSVLTDKLS